MRALNLSLLGTLAITVDGNPIEVASNHGRALLLYLVVEKSRPHRREALAEMFWPEKPEGVARNSLKQALSNLRRAMGERNARSPFLLVSRDEIQFNQSSRCWVDVEELQGLVGNCVVHQHENALTCATCENWLLRAVDLYRGNFLADFYLPDNQDFNDWVTLKREALQRQISDVLCWLAQILETRGDYKGASDYCRQLAEQEPWNEENHRNMMRLLALSGMRSAALRQYQICCENLKKELGVEPSNATLTLYNEIETWEEGNFPAQALLRIPVEKEPPENAPEIGIAGKPVLYQKRSRWIVLALAITGIVLGIGSIYNMAASGIPATAGDSVDQELSRNQLETAANTIAPTTVGLSSSSNAGISERELHALESLYNQTGGANWGKSDGWLSAPSPCQWYGITCRGGKIVELKLADNQLNGVIPPEIGQLADLENLDLGDNQLRGAIPPEIGSLSKLRHLILWGNRELSGSIPPELGNLSNLEDLELAHWNSGGSLLSGEIPPELGNLKNLRSLHITQSLLRGPLPVELCSLKLLRALDLASNRLSGPIPPELGTMLDLEFLDLGGNDFEGPIPSELGNLTMLNYLSFGVGLLSGEIPAELGGLVRLRYLVLDNTKLSGPLPLTLMNLNLRELTFFGTEVCEPANQAFQDWLESIDEMNGTNVVCSQAE
jgi:DNA-binding SARP family transcriptional activator/Leucine-rich repeat (LRR) protein